LDRAASSTVPSTEFQWDTLRRLQRVQVFGADEGAGREIALELLRRGHPPGGLFMYGRRPCQLDWRGEMLTVGPIHGNTPGADLAILCTNPELASKLIPILQARGTRVVDQTGAHRADPLVPLVLADLNPQEIGAFADVVAVPGGTASLLALLLASLDRVVGLAAVDGFVQLARAGSTTRAALTEPMRFELEIASDLRRVLGRSDLPIDLTVVPGGHDRCDTFAMRLQLKTALGVEAVTGFLAAAPGIQLAPDPAGPLAEACVGGSEIHVGRIRAGSRGAVSLCCFAAGDQLRAGAALAALRVAAQMPAGI
jgi:aspartate-semialdehyde dehydrogenase